MAVLSDTNAPAGTADSHIKIFQRLAAEVNNRTKPLHAKTYNTTE